MRNKKRNNRDFYVTQYQITNIPDETKDWVNSYIEIYPVKDITLLFRAIKWRLTNSQLRYKVIKNNIIAVLRHNYSNYDDFVTTENIETSQLEYDLVHNYVNYLICIKFPIDTYVRMWLEHFAKYE